MIRLTRIEVLEVDCSCRHQIGTVGSTALLVPSAGQRGISLTRRQGAFRALVAGWVVPILLELLCVISTGFCYAAGWAAKLASDAAKLASEDLLDASRKLHCRSYLLSHGSRLLRLAREAGADALARNELEP